MDKGTGLLIMMTVALPALIEILQTEAQRAVDEGQITIIVNVIVAVQPEAQKAKYQHTDLHRDHHYVQNCEQNAIQMQFVPNTVEFLHPQENHLIMIIVRIEILHPVAQKAEDEAFAIAMKGSAMLIPQTVKLRNSKQQGMGDVTGDGSNENKTKEMIN